MKLLALDTATEACSAALWIDGQVEERYIVAPRGHARLLLPMIETLLQTAGLRPAGLDAVAFGCGPGSFTGLRIAAGITQGLAYGARIPVVPVSTLQALAYAALRESEQDHVLTAIDARMAEVYWAYYRRVEGDRPRLVGSEQVCAPEQVVAPPVEAWCGVGSGWAVYAAVLERQLEAPVAQRLPEALPHAADIASLAAMAFEHGEAVPAEAAQPVYLRHQVAEKPRSIEQ